MDRLRNYRTLKIAICLIPREILFLQMTILKPYLQEPVALIKDIYCCHESTGQPAKQILLLRMRNTKSFSDLLKLILLG